MTALMNKTIEECFFRLPYFVLRSIKGTDNAGVCERIRSFYAEYESGGFASTDFGSFDSSVTDKCTADHKKPGIRRIIEEALMNAVAKRFPDSADYKNSAKTRWKKKDTILFDTVTLITEVMIRYSGDSLTSVGNYIINWFMDRTVDFIAEAIFTLWDWSEYTLEELVECLPSMLEDASNIRQIIDFVAWKAQYAAKTILRVSKGQSIQARIRIHQRGRR